MTLLQVSEYNRAQQEGKLMPEMVKTFTDRKHCDEIFVANLYCRKNLIKITLHGGISLPKLKKINPELRRKKHQYLLRFNNEALNKA